ncbi:MAG TPA: hypothetical protein VGE02_16340 [Gemmatimonadales bacterium]
MRTFRTFLLATSLLALGIPGCAPRPQADPAPRSEVEATSLLGEPLARRGIPGETRVRLEAQLAAARSAYDRAPQDADSIIWFGRRLAYLERYGDAIDVFSEGIEKHPDDARMYRHRGHRLITLRRFDEAIADLERAAELVAGKPDEVEPDGAPNRLNIPLSTTQGNIYYHLALAHYLKSDYQRALPAWQHALRVARNDDTRVAVTDWLYMTLRRLGRDDEARALVARVSADLDIIENDAYHRRLLFYRGALPADSLLSPDVADELQYVTQGYGVANWYLAEGDTARANEIFDRLLGTGYWAAFGYIAAEADVARRRSASP